MSERLPSERVAAGGSHSSENFLVSEEVTPCFGGSGPWVGGQGFVAVQSQGFRQDPCEKAHVCSTQLQRGRSKPRAQIIRRLTLESGRWDGARTAAGENAGASRAARFALTCPARVSLPSWVVRVARLLPCWLGAPQTRVLRQSWAKGEALS